MSTRLPGHPTGPKPDARAYKPHAHTKAFPVKQSSTIYHFVKAFYTSLSRWRTSAHSQKKAGCCWIQSSPRALTSGWNHVKALCSRIKLFDCHANGRAAARYGSRTDHQQLEHVPLRISLPKFETTTTNSKVEPGTHGTYVLLPFRALEEIRLPYAIQQKWEVSVAASRSAEWRMWFQRLDPAQQKSHIQSLYKSTKDWFWAKLWLEYEEWSRSKLWNSRYVALAARVQVLIERELISRQLEKPRLSWQTKCARVRRYSSPPKSPRPTPILPHNFLEPLSRPLSAPLTAQNIKSLKLRLAPSYFRLPESASWFARRIFHGKFYEEAVAVAVQKANFNSWVTESRIVRGDGKPYLIVSENYKAYKDDVDSIAKMK